MIKDVICTILLCSMVVIEKLLELCDDNRAKQLEKDIKEFEQSCKKYVR